MSPYNDQLSTAASFLCCQGGPSLRGFVCSDCRHNPQLSMSALNLTLGQGYQCHSFWISFLRHQFSDCSWMKFTLAYIIHFTKNLPIYDLIYMHTLVEIEWVSSFLYTLIKPNITLKSLYNTPIEAGGCRWRQRYSVITAS